MNDSPKTVVFGWIVDVLEILQFWLTFSSSNIWNSLKISASFDTLLDPRVMKVCPKINLKATQPVYHAHFNFELWLAISKSIWQLEPSIYGFQLVSLFTEFFFEDWSILSKVEIFWQESENWKNLKIEMDKNLTKKFWWWRLFLYFAKKAEKISQRQL